MLKARSDAQKKTVVIHVVQAKPFLRNVGREDGVVTKRGKTRKRRKRIKRKTKMVLEFRTIFKRSCFSFIIQYINKKYIYKYV